MKLIINTEYEDWELSVQAAKRLFNSGHKDGIVSYDTGNGGKSFYVKKTKSGFSVHSNKPSPKGDSAP